MNVSLDLFELIKSLSKSEKRYFRLSASLQKGDKAYLKIFDLIEKQGTYDEKELKMKFKNEKFIKHLPFTKRYLYNSIIKSLLAYNNEKSAEHKLVEQLLKAKLLYNRSLFSQAQAARSKAKTLARKHEKDYLYFELVRTEIQTLKRSRYGIDIKDNIFKEEKFINEKIQNLYNYSKLYVDLAGIRLTHGFIRAEEYQNVLEDILRHQLPDINESSTVKERYLHLSTFVRIASLKGDMETMLSSSKDILAFVESNPDSFEDDNILELIQAYLDIFHPSIKSGQFGEYEHYLKKFRLIMPKSPVDEINMFLVICLSEISKFLAKAEFKEGINFIKYAESGLEKYRGKLHPDDESVILYNISRLYMGSGEYEKALEYSNRLLGRQAAEMRPDIYIYAKVLNLVIHYELGNDELVRYLIRSVYKLFKKREKLYRFESLLLSFLRKMPAMLTREDFMDNLILFRKEMLLLQNDPFEKNAFIYFDFISWAESKIHNKSFEEIVKEKVFA
jgi:hypothetical protein